MSRAVPTIKLLHADASDLHVINAMLASTGRMQDSIDPLKDTARIKRMVRDKHGSVFEHNSFTFAVTDTIATSRQWHRHRVGHSYNEVSGRYVELPEDWYVPYLQREVGKAMDYEREDFSPSVRRHLEAAMDRAYEKAFESYHELLEAGVAKESARLVLPLGAMTSMVWTCNARSLMSFIELRADDHAQLEIRYLARLAELTLEDLMPITCEAFRANGRKAP